MRILGVDPGSRAAGWAVVRFDASPELVAAGVLRPPAELSFPRRLLFLRDGLREVIAAEKPDLSAVERVFSGVNPQSLITLGEARGVLLLAIAESGLELAEITPAEIKRSIAGNGGAEKEQVRRMVASLLGGRRLALDAADAAAAALTQGFLMPRRRSTLLARSAPVRGEAVRRGPTG